MLFLRLFASQAGSTNVVMALSNNKRAGQGKAEAEMAGYFFICWWRQPSGRGLSLHEDSPLSHEFITESPRPPQLLSPGPD